MSMAWMHIEENEGSVFIVPPFKDQSPIIFGKTWYWITTSNKSNEDLEPSQFFYYARSAHCMMKEIGYDLRYDEGLNFEKEPYIPP